MSDESSYEFLDENDADNQNEYYEYDLKYDPENKNENPEYWNRKKRIKWNVMLFFGCMLLYSTRTSLSICVSRMSKDYGWDKRISGIVLSSFFFGYILTQILGGILADRYGGENMLFLSAFVWSISTFCLPMVGHVSIVPLTVGIIVTQVLTGAAQGIHFPALTSLLCKRVSIENRNTAYSIAASGTAVGNIFCGITGSIILESHGWQSVFFTTGGLAMLWMLIVGMLIFSEKTINVVKASFFVKSEPVPWRLFIRQKPFWALIVCATCESVVFINLLSWLPSYFHDEFPESKGLLFNVLPWVASFIVTNVCGVLSDNMTASGVSVTKTRKIFVGISLIAPTIFCIILNYVSSFTLALILMTSIIGLMSCNSSGIGVNPQDLSLKNAGYIYGFMNSMGSLAGTCGVYLTGHILHHSTNEWSFVFYMTSVVSFIGFLSFELFGSGERID